MRPHIVVSLLLVAFKASASPASPPYPVRNLLGLDQVPIGVKDDPITRTRTVTHTHIAINVVSTVYKTRPQPTPVEIPALSSAAEVAALAVPVWRNRHTGSKCNIKVCAVCRVMNNCEDGAAECPNCDRAEYCWQCAPQTEMVAFDELVVESHGECLVVPGKDMECNLESRMSEHHVEAYDGRS